MLKRTITAVCALCIFIPVCYFSDTVIFPAAMTLLSLIAAYEMLNCVGAKRIYSAAVPSYIIALTPMIPFFSAKSDSINIFQILTFIVFLYLVWLLAVTIFSKGKIKFELATAVFTSIFYVIITFTSIVALRYGQNGKYIYLLVFVGAWVSDTFAYFCGRFFGKHKLIPDISPKKTIEGSIGGILFTSIGFVVYGIVISHIYELSSEPRYLLLAITGAAVSVISQIGDLAASLIKRSYGIKDYGFVFPGHGGVMDRFDSVLLTAPMLLIISSLPHFNSILF